eukprot:5557156-Pyramimonas_sp.AAC.1
MELSWRPLGALLERSWGRFRGPLGPCWTPVGPSWGPLGLFWNTLGDFFWGGLGGLVGRLGASENPEGELVKHVRLTDELLRLGTLLGRILEASWGLVGTSYAV